MPGPDVDRPWDRIAIRLALAAALLLVGVSVGLGLTWSRVEDAGTSLTEARDQLVILRMTQASLQERNWTLYREIEALEAELEQMRSAEEDTGTSGDQAADGTRDTYSDGTYLVGEDIPSGVYDGIVTGDVGYWARLKGTTGMVNAIITNDLPRGPFVLTIYAGDKAVELRGVEITLR